ncbi:hypothetical protein BLNAU_15218 [Blattamonas nauphoetae]|uniref:VWFA domain-containing protein n=1 Tax=Blattamonas nauphoetae TaxID=2049346 RepID=A0ABQ9XBB6_9EUKA|nr:hypothetical protein BLNAU_15218 [Blattamonas nauphoetae]
MTNDQRRQIFFAIDISGSTSHRFYYDHVLTIFNDMYKPGDVILFWHDSSFFVDHKLARLHFSRAQGLGGTSPSEILTQITSNGFSTTEIHLVLITDGEIDVEEIDSCDALIKMNSIQFGFVSTFIISKMGNGNMSVAASFNRQCGSTVTILRDETRYGLVAPSVAVSNADMLLLSRINTINTFAELSAAFDGLTRALTARMLGSKGDRALHDEVVAMRTRIARTFSQPHSSAADELSFAIDRNDLEGAILAGGQIVTEYNHPSGYESMTNLLIRLTDGALRYTFTPDEINAARATRATDVAEASTMNAVPVTQGPDEGVVFHCPLSVDDEVDACIMIAQPARPLLIGVEKKQTDLLIDSPLNALHSPDFVTKLMDHCDHAVSLGMVREAENTGHPLKTSPITRKALLGFLPLGPHETHVKAADWTLSQLISGGKALGNKDLWFAVIWFLVKRDKLEFLKELEPFIRAQLIFRLKRHKTAASMTGLSNFIMTPLRMDCAIFFTLCSALFSPRPSVASDPLKLHSLHAQELVELADLADVPVPPEIRSNIVRTVASLRLLAFTKRHPRDYVEVLGQMLFQNGFCVDRANVDSALLVDPLFSLPYIPLDGRASQEQQRAVMKMLPSACSTLPLNEVYWLLRRVDASMSGADVDIPLDWHADPLPPPKLVWRHYEGKFSEISHVTICHRTLRPYSVLDDGRTWKERFFEIIPQCRDPPEGLGKPVFSVHKLFMIFVGRLNRVPTVEETLLFLYARMVRSEKPIPTLVSYAPALVQSVIDDFIPLLAGQLRRAVKRFRDSASVVKRMEMEKGKD